MAESNVAIIERFLAEWCKGKAAMYQSIHDHLAPGAVWENIGLSLTHGAAEAEACFRGFEVVLTFDRIEVDMVHIMGSGNVVMTERVDRCVDAAGNTLMAVRAMGTFELENGKIVAWRDYFDTAPWVAGAPA